MKGGGDSGETEFVETSLLCWSTTGERIKKYKSDRLLAIVGRQLAKIGERRIGKKREELGDACCVIIGSSHSR